MKPVFPLIFGVFFTLFFQFHVAFSQDSLVPTEFEKFHLKRRYTRKADVLAAELTKELNSDKEKFDAIYAWVVRNMKYDYHRYYSGKSFRQKTIKKILKNRKGICTDYAMLMDTLCRYAGIKNVTVTGYIKEVNFDLNDSFYFDTHAWNAVKLNNLWYVYDATWSSGYSVYEYKKLAKWRIRQLAKLKKKTKQVTLEFKKRKKKQNKYCPVEPASPPKTITVDRIRFFPRMLIGVLNAVSFKMKEKAYSVANSTYYLTNPEVFAVTHFPNDPVWSLTTRITNCLEFSADSAFYDPFHFEELDQKRNGRMCAACDYYESSDELLRAKLLAEASRINNKNNHFVPAVFYLKMAQYFTKNVVSESDSLTKLRLIDSAKLYINASKAEFRLSNKMNSKELREQNKKNNVKRKLLETDNENYFKSTGLLMQQVSRKRNKIVGLKKRSERFDQREKHAVSIVNRIIVPAKSKGKMDQKKKDLLLEQAKQEISKADSLSNLITVAEHQFDQQIESLWENLIIKLNNIDLVIENFYLDGDERLFELNDQYDFAVKKYRIQIDSSFNQLKFSLNNDVLSLSDSVRNEFLKLYALARTRDMYIQKAVKSMYKLQANNLMSIDSVKLLKLNLLQFIYNDICWNEDNNELIHATAGNFIGFIRQLRRLKKTILFNTRFEKRRYLYTEKHIRRNINRQKEAIHKNVSILAKFGKIIYSEQQKLKAKK